MKNLKVLTIENMKNIECGNAVDGGDKLYMRTAYIAIWYHL